MRAKSIFFIGLLLLNCFSISAFSQEINKKRQNTLMAVPVEEELLLNVNENQLKIGAANFNEYLPLLVNKKVALVANHTSKVGNEHLLDTLLSYKVKIVKVFAPEHGFRGDADAGETVKNQKDKKTGIPLISLYGKNKKPSPKDLGNVDVVIFDMQDVGVRFYTYISTLHYVMEACAEQKKLLIVLDRPNPNGFYVDGSVLKTEFKSFVGMHPVPVVHGLTIGEYAMMINGEYWLHDSIKCNLKVIKVSDYSHRMFVEINTKPSPNLRDMSAIYLYPSLCFFEGTNVSVGRGTDSPFKIYGSPYLKNTNFQFKPKPSAGAKEPMHKDLICYGFNLEKQLKRMPDDLNKKINLSYLLFAYNNTVDSIKPHFFNNFFQNLAGDDQLKKMIIEGKKEDDIRKTWEKDLMIYKEKRRKYLLYEDFK